jgi:hypothetical protein
MAILNLLPLLQFFDEGIDGSQGHATACNAMMGEDLGIGLIKHYFENSENKVSEVKVTHPCTQGTKSGVRLDGWLTVQYMNETPIDYQVEIKNWSSHSLGGRKLPAEASDEDKKLHRLNRWKRQWNEETFQLKEKTAKKVLVPMRPINNHSKVLPLICFWDSMHPEGLDEALFEVDTNNKLFPKLWVFSMSNYVRFLRLNGKESIEIEMQDTENRLNWMNKFLV